MKKIIHRASERGFVDHGWLKAYHSFSFASWYDPDKMGFGLLRVLNNDTVAPGKGFGLHPHDNMEIVTIILKGSLKHRDSMGNEGIIAENEIQSMSAGSGIMHSEFNPSDSEPCELFQIWVMPSEQNIKPRYEQMKFSPENKNNKFLTLVSPKPEHNAMFINQDAYFSIANVEKNKTLNYILNNSKNGIYVMVVEGQIKTVDEILGKRDAAGVWDIKNLEIIPETDSEILIIEVPID